MVGRNLRVTFRAWRCGGFTPLMLIRSTQFKFTKNCHTKHVTRHYAKPLLAAGVLSTVLVNHCLYVVQVSGCAFGYFFFFRRAGKFFYSIFFRETSTLFLQLWFACRLVAAAKCVCLCALAFYFANCNILYAPLATMINTIAPMIKSGYDELSQCTKSPAVITPVLIITSFEVKIILACIWASLLLPFCSR